MLEYIAQFASITPKEALAKHFDIPLHNALQMKIVVNTATGFGNCVLS